MENHVYNVVDGADGFEDLRIDLPSSDTPQARDQINRVDAVDVEIVIEPSVERYRSAIDFEHLFQDLCQPLEYFVAILHQCSLRKLAH
jgi:hypothetical protein